MRLRRVLAATALCILAAGSSALAQDGTASPSPAVRGHLHPRMQSHVRVHLHQMTPRIHVRASHFKHMMGRMRAKTRDLRRMHVAESRLMRSQMRMQMRELKRMRMAPMRLHRNGSSSEI